MEENQNTTWKQKGKNIGKVKKYQGNGFKRNGENDKQINEMVKGARIVAKHTWDIGERKFDGEFISDMMYRIEIWGQEKQKKIEQLHIQYNKWILELNKTTQIISY